MKRLFLVIHFLLLCCYFSSSAQIAFQRTYGGSLINEGRSVLQTMDGGYIIAGSTSSFGNGSTDVLLIKTDSFGNAQFMKTYGGSNVDRGYAVLQLSDSGYAIAGYTNSFGNGGYDAYLVRTDKNGDTLWTKTYGGSGWDFILSCKLTADSGFVMAGNTYSYGNGNSDSWIIKTDALGNTVWEKTFLNNGDDIFNSVDLGFNAGGYVATGYHNNGSSSIDSIIVARVSLSGDSVWFYNYGNTLSQKGNAIRLISDSSYIIGGQVIDSNNVDAIYTKGFLMKIDTSGQLVWMNTGSVANKGYNDLLDFIEQPGDTFVLAATNTQYGGGGIEVFQVFTDKYGYYISGPTHGDAGTDICYSISKTSDNGFIMAGETDSWGPGLKAVFLVKTDNKGGPPAMTTTIGVNEVKNDFSFLNIYPNPNQGTWFLNVPKSVYYSGELTIKVFDLLGNQVFLKRVSDSAMPVEVRTPLLLPGIYIVELLNGQEAFVKRKLVIE